MHKILIVEDNKNSRNLMVKLLEKKGGLQALSAENGFQALISLQQETDIKVIILDWEMPEMNGVELLKTIKAMDELSRIPVIMQTANENRKARLEAIQQGAFAFITKPIDFELLHAYIESAIAHIYPKS